MSSMPPECLIQCNAVFAGLWENETIFDSHADIKSILFTIRSIFFKPFFKLLGKKTTSNYRQ